MAAVVISYSRQDRGMVRILVGFLKAAFRGVDRAVYWDEDFEPGDPWFEQMTEQIDAAQQLFVFWCGHSAQSAQVKREFEYALQKGARVVPVLVDNTPLDPALAPIHGVDLRELAGSAHPLPSFLPMVRKDFDPRSMNGMMGFAARPPVSRSIEKVRDVFLPFLAEFDPVPDEPTPPRVFE